ncbi:MULTISPECIES: MobV family relaxase [Bacteroides]|uniref:MobV family relaxase n=1 Tax=Bacteroides TaxID=816 RepID=UPI0001EFFBD7|nr:MULTISPECIES: MobV family relaxase [Bacteroides]EFV24458.1 plasmid recombination enzyme [Bacteroides sp. 4_1_36]
MAKQMKQVMDIRASKGMTVGQSNEHQRRWSEKGWNNATATGNYDRSREPLNFEIKKGGIISSVDKRKSIPQLMAENLAERGIKDPNEGREIPKYRTVVNFIFGGTRERMLEIAFGNQKVDLTQGADNSHIKRSPDIERWAQDMYRFASDKWGEENIVAFIVHLDETNPHVHMTLLPIDKDKKFAFKKMFAGKDKYEYKEIMLALHDELAKVNEKWGLMRGDSIAVTGAKHRTTEEYKRELSGQCTTLEGQIEENKKILKQLYDEIRFAEKRVKGLTTMTLNLEQRKDELEKEIATVNEELKNGKGNSEELHERIKKLDNDLQKVLDNLADKQAKLEQANEQLDELKNLKDKTKDMTEQYRQQLRLSTSNLTQQVRFRLADVLLDDLIRDFKMILPTLSPGTKESLDDSLLQDVTEQGEDIIKCAIFLYANLVDQATNFAKGHGGGGGGSDLPWGRKEDEDDRAWARRCLMMAHRMMKPSGKNIRR